MKSMESRQSRVKRFVGDSIDLFLGRANIISLEDAAEFCLNIKQYFVYSFEYSVEI